MRQLPVHLVGHGALLEHHHDMAGPLRHRRDMQIDDPLRRGARRAEIDLVFVDGAAALTHLLDQRQQRTAERDEIAQRMPAQQRDRNIEKILRGRVGVADPVVGADDQHGEWQGIEHRLGGADRRCRIAGAGEAHAAALHARRRECIGEPALGFPRGRRRQHVARASLEGFARRPRARGRGIERPADMLAGMLFADALAMMGEHLVIKRRYGFELRPAAAGPLRGGRPGEAPRHLARKPRPPLAPRADHHGIGPRAGERRRVPSSRLGDIAVDDDRDRDRRLDGADRGPVGAAGIELAARAAVHRDQLHACCLGPTRQFRRIDASRDPSRAASSTSPAPRPPRRSRRSAATA